MATILQQLFCLSLLLLVCPADCSSDDIIVYQFPLDTDEENYLTIQPEKPAMQATGFSLCLRAMFWTWNYRVLLVTGNMWLGLDSFYARRGFYNNGQNVFYFPWDNMNVSPSKWNTFCISYNQSSSIMNITINGQLAYTVHSSAEFEPNPIVLGSQQKTYRFFGQLTDFNFWNKPLTLSEMKEFSFGCNTNKLLQKVKPEFVLWSGANITFSGVSITKYSMKREFLCSLLANSSVPDSLLLFGGRLSYKDSIAACEELNGKIVLLGNTNENFLKREERSLKELCSNQFWVFTNNSKEQTSKQELIVEGYLTENHDQCFYYDVTREGHYQTGCNSFLCSVCQIAEDRLKFHVKSAFNQQFLESQNFLVNYNGNFVFTGLNRQTVIKLIGNSWSALYYNNIANYYLDSAFFIFGNLQGKTRFPIGLQTLTYNGQAFQMKVSNVSNN